MKLLSTAKKRSLEVNFHIFNEKGLHEKNVANPRDEEHRGKAIEGKKNPAEAGFEGKGFNIILYCGWQ